MPTKKRRVGFIPRGVVLDLINKLSFENNLSNSKIINILVEEALYKRGLFNIKTGTVLINIKDKNNQIIKDNINEEFNYQVKNNPDIYENMDTREGILDNEIYSKFLIFLQFQEKMKRKSFD
tara:strand:- start:8 stop:373 length:366 start_codon:yes stop_codon:yes gene_type:complete